MNETIYELYHQAGSIAAQARDHGAQLIKEGTSYLEVAESIEKEIIENGAQIAFPVNISVDSIAAHYTPKTDDTLLFKKGDLVKLDVGAHIQGYIADTAITIEIETNEHQQIIKASEKALENAIEMMRPDIELSEIGHIIQQTIQSYGYTPIANLTGHSLQQYNLHAGLSIPNIPECAGNQRPQIDDVIAIEPFATTGSGRVISGQGSNIYRCQNSLKARFIRDHYIKQCYSRLLKEFTSLPFSERQANKTLRNAGPILRRLEMYGVLHHYPQLKEARNGLVSQKEHTVIITEQGCEITTQK